MTYGIFSLTHGEPLDCFWVYTGAVNPEHEITPFWPGSDRQTNRWSYHTRGSWSAPPVCAPGQSVLSWLCPCLPLSAFHTPTAPPAPPRPLTSVIHALPRHVGMWPEGGTASTLELLQHLSLPLSYFPPPFTCPIYALCWFPSCPCSVSGRSFESGCSPHLSLLCPFLWLTSLIPLLFKQTKVESSESSVDIL